MAKTKKTSKINTKSYHNDCCVNINTTNEDRPRILYPQRLSTEFIRKLEDAVDWTLISKNQHLSPKTKDNGEDGCHEMM